ncbi:MAG: hypothetical protein ACR2FN_07190 [Chitinophagaceae bacterium]
MRKVHFSGIIEKAIEIRLATQSNFDNLFSGGHRIAIISITPPEKGLFIMNQNNNSAHTQFFKKLATSKKLPFTGTITNEVLNMLTGFSIEDLIFCKFDTTDYYNDLLKPEYEFLKKSNGKKGEGGYTLCIVNNYAQIEAALKNEPNTLCIIISIEGMHSLYNAPHLEEFFNKQTSTHKKDADNLMSLSGYMANIQDMKNWEHPPLFITFCHHAWNGLGGHARSLNRMMNVFFDQEEGINLGINKLGIEVIKNLLSTKNGKRILIDIKHMSPRSRKDFYNLLRSNTDFKNEKIPVICSLRIQKIFFVFIFIFFILNNFNNLFSGNSFFI